MEWKDIKGFETRYEVSDEGQIRSKKKGVILRPGKKAHGYLFVGLATRTADGKRCKKYYHVHRLVAQAFIPNPDGKSDVDHIDGVKTNNHVSNLRWCTRKENVHNEATYGKTQMHIKKLNTDPEHLRQLSSYVNKMKRPVRCIETGQEWDSIREAATAIGVPFTRIRAACNRTARGKSCRYSEYRGKSVYHFEWIAK